jgi:hypothetical protein
MVHQAVDESRMHRSDFAKRQPVSTLGQGDKPESAGGENDGGVFRRVAM